MLASEILLWLELKKKYKSPRLKRGLIVIFRAL